ncbi:hypothetical protein BABINDRAFT_166634 [Babjeviella inositovora NRRL Y-12698]|uniref:Kinetochore protein Sos7 coiled-coil domain-containing protein n=1 Tax=Babjeviella inositovora NRRL Y-12698 TaxID=984486 RepID=A0A1E3QRG2_9ASCO|nr:uncharacterized protein BABINDRAFT_166634 [Babjeviella inositovora NRRL Y-12698]ODQ80285.1 hypothetical protein BABINDRAFT_166634 [Babjeviella inositovora NRRL Y-12698]
MSEKSLQEIRDKQAGLSLSLAKEDFERGINNINNFHETGSQTIEGEFVNPKAIDDDIKQKKELYKQLKFQYLEQETKEKFLRIILDNPPRYIDNSDLAEIDQQTSALKQGLRTKKASVEQRSKQLEALSAEVLIENRQLDSNIAEISNGMQAIAAMQAEIDQLENEDWNNEDNTLLQINDLLKQTGEPGESHSASTIPDIKSQIQLKRQGITQLDVTVGAAQSEAHEAESALASSKSTLKELTDQNRGLVRTIEEERLLAEAARAKSDATGLLGDARSKADKWLNELINIWCSFSNPTIEDLDILPLDEHSFKLVMKIRDRAPLTLHMSKTNFTILRVEPLSEAGSATQIIQRANRSADPINYFMQLFVHQ